VEGKSEREANALRKKTLTELEQACEEASSGSETGPLKCESVPLYNGGQYWLYKYKRYEDVRLVFAPEAAVAFFGGDPDNFNYPRFCLDMAFLRAYENGQPASTPTYLRWRAEGPREGEAVFVTGHPGSTDRMLTVADLLHLRNVVLPHWLMRNVELRGRLTQFATQGGEATRHAQNVLFGLENGIKVRRHELLALLDDELLAHKRDEEKKLRQAVAADPELLAASGSAWQEIAAAREVFARFRDEYVFLEGGGGRAAAFGGNLFGYARTLVRAATERDKPNAERLREFTEAAMPRRRQLVLAARPVYPELEQLRLSFSLDKMREFLGPDSAHVKQIQGVESPDALAAKLVGGTRLGDVAYRKALWEGGHEAIEASDDPLIQLALAVDPTARALRSRFEQEVEAPIEAAYEKIARARFVIQGSSRYPDATFTLRLTYGAVEGWEEKGETVAPFTTIGRTYERVTGKSPFRLPRRWVDAKPKLNLRARFNYVATTDITGGNSGSPLIDKDAKIVGLAFDGNIHSIAGSYWFDESKNRTVAVHPEAMLEALKVVYEADHLVAELSTE